MAGDFNDEPDRSAALSEAIRTGEWTDLAQLQAYKSDPPAAPGNTFVTESGASRIDQLYANQEAQAAFQELAVGEPGEYGFPGHPPLFATFKWAQLFQKVNKLAKPADLPPREAEGGKAEKEAKAAWLAAEGENLIEKAGADWTAAVQARDTEAAWKIWCTSVETLFLRWAKQEGI